MTTPETTDLELFPPAPYRVPPPDGVERTRGERLRERQAARIAHGCHPLSIYGVCIPLHPDASRTTHPTDPTDSPRCGTCRHREPVGGHACSFPKCMFASGVRVSSSEATDVRAWWPACVDYERRAET